MKRFTETLTILSVFLLLSISAESNAVLDEGSINFQSEKNTKTHSDSSAYVNWRRVRSDNGEFSVEVPEIFTYFFDKKGFWCTHGSEDFKMENVSILNTFADQTLLSVEAYRTKKIALKKMLESHKRRREKVRKTSFAGQKIYEVDTTKRGFRSVRKFFMSKNSLYVLTAASRNGKTFSINRFFESVKFSAEKASSNTSDSTPFSELKVTPIKIEDHKNRPYKKPAKLPTSDDRSARKRIIIIYNSPPNYTDAARQKNVQGRILLRLKFTKNGSIPTIGIIKPLPHGLTRQAIFAALRIKFLPEMMNDQAIETTKTLRYSFSIY